MKSIDVWIFNLTVAGCLTALFLPQLSGSLCTALLGNGPEHTFNECSLDKPNQVTAFISDHSEENASKIVIH